MGAPRACASRSFNPRPPRGGRRASPPRPRPSPRFQSAPPARGATSMRQALDKIIEVSIRAPRAGGDAGLQLDAEDQGVSIRAPRAGGDYADIIRVLYPACFNPRPPRGGRPNARIDVHFLNLFQSAPPARGATASSAVRRERSRVSIRAPRAGGDVVPGLDRVVACGVSIRAPRAGGDVCGPSAARTGSGFNPRPPRGGRPSRNQARSPHPTFQSAPPARGATGHDARLRIEADVSIRAPRAGGDRRSRARAGGGGSFNPRPPRGGRQAARLRDPVLS